MPSALLDKNVGSDLMRDHAQVRSRLAAHQDAVATSAVVADEIHYGLDRLPPGKRRQELETKAHVVLSSLLTEPVTESVAEIYGRLKATLETQGVPRDDNDLWIDSTAISLRFALISRDQTFGRIPGLQAEDWSV